MKRIFLCLWGACISLFTYAVAQEPTPTQNAVQNNDLFLYETLANFNIENVTPVLDRLSLPYFQGAEQGGAAYLVVLEKSSGLKFVMMPMACTDKPKTTCKALNIIALFSNSPPQQAVNAFNYRYNFISAGLDPSGAPFLSRYELGAFGVPVGNLVTSLMLFVHTAKEFSETMKNATKTVRTDSYSNDLSAQYLNLQALLQDKFGAPFVIDHTNADHALNVEATSGLVSRLFASEGVTRARMVNDILAE